MSTPRERAEQLFSRSDKERVAHSRRDQEIFALRKAQDAENHAKTERLKALRLAHEATLEAAKAANPAPEPAGKTRKTKAPK